LSRYAQLGASSRLRSYQYLTSLEASGFRVTVSYLFDNDYVAGIYAGKVSVFSVFRSYILRLIMIIRAHQYDLVWVEYEMLPWIPHWFELWFIRSIPRIVVDYDDAIFHRYDQHDNWFVRRILGKKIDFVMRRADLVLAGNEYIADRARNVGASRVVLHETVLDLSRYTVSHNGFKRPVVIGWIGTPNTARYLNLIASVMRQLTVSHEVRFVAVGANADQLSGLPIEVRQWTEDNEVSEIQRFDIGIMPLPDEPFERGKCGYKLIQYMACGIPVVASPVGVNISIVRDGVEGFLANTTEDWVMELGKLCDDIVLRKRLGNAARLRVEKDFSLQVAAPRLSGRFSSLVH
jgi:glycosyltransferase involved in cell wall biosynthesis